MKLRKSGGIMVLTISLVLFFTGLAGAQILNNAGQMVNLFAANASNPVSFNSLSSRTPDGGSSTWGFPANSVLVVTKMKYSFSFTSTLSTAPYANGTPVILAIGPFYTKRTTLALSGVSGSWNYFASDIDNIPTGFVIGSSAWTGNNVVKVYLASDGSQTPIANSAFGSLQLIGFTAPNQ